jgi:predicted TIM-barrel fold metal-dependent hydrolase
VWATAGALGLPVLIHTADPVAFWWPVDERNERWDELQQHPEWSFHGAGVPSWERLIDALEAAVAAHPGTVFVAAHVASAAEDLALVSRLLDDHPNLHVDVSARIGELGRQPRAARRLLLRHPDRVLFGTDAFPPQRAMYERHFRFLETDDEYFPYGTDPDDPHPQGRWRISALDLPDDVLRAVYAGNARRILDSGGQ